MIAFWFGLLFNTEVEALRSSETSVNHKKIAHFVVISVRTSNLAYAY
jgi:hypothetical protein